jgi:hypothetical protein
MIFCFIKRSVPDPGSLERIPLAADRNRCNDPQSDSVCGGGGGEGERERERERKSSHENVRHKENKSL